MADQAAPMGSPGRAGALRRSVQPGLRSRDVAGRVGAGETQPGVADRRCRWPDPRASRADGRAGCPRRAPSGAQGRHLLPAAGARAGDPEALGEAQKPGHSRRVRDRIVQTAAKLVLEPIFEADFCPTSYGFRPGRRAQDAIEEVRFFINAPRSYEWVIEGDVEDCFGSIHHGSLAGPGAPSGDRQARPAADPAVPRRGDHARAWLPGRDAIGHATRVESLAPDGERRPLGTRPPLRERPGSARWPPSARVTGRKATPATG